MPILKNKLSLIIILTIFCAILFYFLESDAKPKYEVQLTLKKKLSAQKVGVSTTFSETSPSKTNDLKSKNFSNQSIGTVNPKDERDSVNPLMHQFSFLSSSTIFAKKKKILLKSVIDNAISIKEFSPEQNPVVPACYIGSFYDSNEQAYTVKLYLSMKSSDEVPSPFKNGWVIGSSSYVSINSYSGEEWGSDFKSNSRFILLSPNDSDGILFQIESILCEF